MKNSNTKLTHIERLVQIDKAFFCANALQDHDVWDIYKAAEDAHLNLRTLIVSGTTYDIFKESQQIRELIIALHDEWAEQIEMPYSKLNMSRFDNLANELEAIFSVINMLNSFR